MTVIRLAFLGFGNVGQALARLLLSKRQELAERSGLELIVTGVATGRHGLAIDPAGIDLEAALAAAAAGDDLGALSAVSPPPADAFDFVRRCGADVLLESIPVHYADGQPALDLLRLAIACGMHAVTANKGPVIHGWRELTAAAQAKGRKFFFEATVMDGAPIFSLFREALPGVNLLNFCGVLNSTTNMILTRMERGSTFHEAVVYCQSIGIAETDPSGDVDGWDAAIKVALLVSVLMGVPLLPDQVNRTGIGHINRQQVLKAEQDCKRWKLVCKAWREGGNVQAFVAPELITPDQPLYHVDGTTSYIEFETDVLGRLTLIEEDPGPHTTAYGMFADLLNAVR